MELDANLIAHRATGTEQCAVLTEPLRGLALQGVDGFILAKHIIADLRLHHGLQHGGAGTGHGVAAHIDHAAILVCGDPRPPMTAASMAALLDGAYMPRKRQWFQLLSKPLRASEATAARLAAVAAARRTVKSNSAETSASMANALIWRIGSLHGARNAGRRLEPGQHASGQFTQS